MPASAPAPAAGGNKTVGSESAPVVSAVLIVSALQDTYGLLVQHEGWWELTPNIFTLAGFALFFGLRRINTAVGAPLDVETVAAFVADHPSNDKAEVAADLRRLAPRRLAPRRGGLLADTPATGMFASFIVFGVVVAGCTYAVLQAAGWLRP